MIFGTNSNYMLKYQKAKAKLVEYDISQKDYPKFPLNSNELSYPVIYILSRYAESIIENDETGKAEFAPYMVKASQYFDASVGANDRTAYDTDFLLSGAAAYFLSNDFGSSKVLCAALFEKIKDTPTMGTSQIILRNLLGYLLLDKVFPISSDTFGGEELSRALLFYYTNGEGLPNIEQAIRKYRTAIYKNNDPMEIYYVDILLAVITIALSKAAWKLIPQYSKLEPGQWEEYLKSSKSPKMLWPAQQLIGKKNVLSGENAIVQLPTGVGKTKSIELIIRSSFLSNRTATAIIVAPLRALCNEIASDMTSAFGESVLINQFSDILENDFFVDFTLKATILICTPEKLSYIIHHQVEFLDEIGLYIFDESHMFDDGRRGTAYELLISEIRKHINSREYDLSGIQKYSNTLEMSRIAKLMADYYGCDHPYTKACNLGVAPHYSNLPNGLRLAIEYAFRKKDLHLVICTSTLAQGVNIPIKYLFMTSFMLDQNSMKIRNFQNLMGRTARSGMYTEGSVIVTDSKLFDNKNNRRNGGFYKWENCVKMFDSHAAEPCESSILWLVQDIEINHDDHVKGVYIANYIINNYSHWDCFESCYEKILQAYERKKQTPMNQKSVAVLKTALTVRQHVIETIENHLCFVLSNDEGSDARVVALELCKETLAYFMANDAEKTLLEKIFDVIAQKAKTVDRVKIKRYSKSMLGIDDALIIEAWLAETQFMEQQLSDSEIFEMLLSFFIDTHKIGKIEEYFPDICRMWLDGYSFIAMKKATGLLISDIESLCSKLISYEFSFFIGNIIDVIDDDDDENRALLVSKLLLLQRKLKYGVCSETAISICEKVFNDRLLANSIAEQIGAESIDTNHIIDALKMCKEKILGFLSVYPTYFSVRINWICK